MASGRNRVRVGVAVLHSGSKADQKHFGTHEAAIVPESNDRY